MKLKRYECSINMYSKVNLYIIWVTRRLTVKGFNVYLLGEYIRDVLLLNEPNNFNVIVNASIKEIKTIFNNYRYISPSVVQIWFPNGYNINLYSWSICNNSIIINTISNKDFTINGLFYDFKNNEIIDFVNGKSDIENKIIRTIGDPVKNFFNNPIHIIRTIKLAISLKFCIEDQTKKAIELTIDNLKYCDPKKLQIEINEILSSGYGEQILYELKKFNIFNMLLPEINEIISNDNFISNQCYNINDLFRFLRTIDNMKKYSVYISLHVIISAILIPVVHIFAKNKIDISNWLDKVFLKWEKRFNFLKYQQNRLCILLSSINILISNKKITQHYKNYIVQKDWFCELLLLYIIYLVTNNESLEKVKNWKILAKSLNVSFRQINIYKN